MAATRASRLERELAVQYAIARAFAEADRLEDIADLVLRPLAEALGWHAAAVWTLGSDGQLECAAIHTVSNRLAAWATDVTGRRFELGSGLPGQVWLSGQPTWIADIDEAAHFPRRELARRVGLRHGVAFPIRSHGAVRAIIELFAADVRQLDAGEVALLEAVGHQLGSFIERIDARRAVAVSEARKAGILGAAVDAIVSADGDGRIVEFNPSAERLFGRLASEVIGRRIAELLVPEEIRAQHEAGLARYMATGERRILGQRVRTSALHADGSRMPVELTVTDIRVEGQPMFTAFIRDISREREAEVARERFLEILSHELRTPVTAIYGGAKVLGRRRVGSTDVEEIIDDISSEADRLYRLVEDLIVLARAERGALAISLEPMRLERIAERVIETFRAAAPKLRFELCVNQPSSLVMADATYVEQLLRNLLSNAVKYGAGAGLIEVVIDHHDAESAIRVLDRGVGIDNAEVRRLFEIDYRSPATEGLAQGSGIGLFVARWLAEGMGGRIWASARDGGGSEFGFALPTLVTDAPLPGAVATTPPTLPVRPIRSPSTDQ